MKTAIFASVLHDQGVHPHKLVEMCGASIVRVEKDTKTERIIVGSKETIISSEKSCPSKRGFPHNDMQNFRQRTTDATPRKFPNLWGTMLQHDCM